MIDRLYYFLGELKASVLKLVVHLESQISSIVRTSFIFRECFVKKREKFFNNRPDTFFEALQLPVKAEECMLFASLRPRPPKRMDRVA